MKTVCFIRHAKSSWDQAGLADIDRPLNLRGKTTAPVMAKLIADKGITPDLIITSPAKRARQTAKSFRKQFGIKKEAVQIEPTIYGGDEHQVIDILRKLPDEKSTVFLFGHNPTMNYLAALFSKERLHVPTCGIMILNLNIERWQDIKADQDALKEFIIPKNFIPEEGED
ncbi:MAG: histidine phosphatase family protein [Saprospiraceae bacterium]